MSATVGVAVSGHIEHGQTPGARIVRPRAWVALCIGLPESLTWTTKSNEPEAVGVPEIIPVPGFRVKPAGREPLAIDHA